MTDLPPGWAQVCVSDVASIQLGRQRSPKDHTGPHMRPYLRAANVGWDGLRLSDVKEMNFDPDEVTTYELAPGDILLNEASGSPNEVGKPVIYNGEVPGACFQNTLLRVKTLGPLTPYLYWYCYYAALTGQFGEAGRGVNIRHLGKKGLADFPIPVAPLAEQRRIVDAIEQHLTRIESAVAACGVVLWRLALLELLTLNELGSGHEKVALGSIIEDGRYGTSEKCSYEDQGQAVLRIPNIVDGGIALSDLKRAPAGVTLSRDLAVASGDLLFVRTNGSADLIGRVGLVGPQAEGLAFASYLIRVRPDQGKADPRFLTLALASPQIREQIRFMSASSAGQYNLGLLKIRQLAVPLPSVQEQQALAVVASEHLEQIRRMALSVRSAVERAGHLRQAILAEAFSGRLVSQNPADEPAQALLYRITEERAAKKQGSRTGTRVAS